MKACSLFLYIIFEGLVIDKIENCNRSSKETLQRQNILRTFLPCAFKWTGFTALDKWYFVRIACVCPTKSAISILDGSLSFNFSPSVWHHFLREYSLESRLLTCWPYHGFAYQRRYAAGDSRNNGSLKNNTMTTTLYLTFRNPIVKTRTFESPSFHSYINLINSILTWLQRTKETI